MRTSGRNPSHCVRATPEISLRTLPYHCRLQMLDFYWRPAYPDINLNVVICCAGAIVGLFEFAKDREVNNSGLLINYRSVAGRDKALTELGHAFRVNISLHVLHKVVPSVWGEIALCIHQAVEIALLEVQRPHCRALRKLDGGGVIFCRCFREKGPTEKNGATNDYTFPTHIYASLLARGWSEAILNLKRRSVQNSLACPRTMLRVQKCFLSIQP